MKAPLKSAARPKLLPFGWLLATGNALLTMNEPTIQTVGEPEIFITLKKDKTWAIISSKNKFTVIATYT